MTKVAVGIIERDGTILICQRKSGGRYGLKWEFPGGKLEPGETVEQCLKRELFEELSIHADGFELFDTRNAFYADGGMFEVAYCRVRSVTGEMRNNVFEDLRWVRPDELHSLDILEGNRPIIEMLAGGR
jgi:8-oxo-dGTP diphosphatase